MGSSLYITDKKIPKSKTFLRIVLTNEIIGLLAKKIGYFYYTL